MRFEFFWWDRGTGNPVTRRLVVSDETVLQCFWDTAKELFQLPIPLDDDALSTAPYSRTYRHLFAGGAYASRYTLPVIRSREEFNAAIFESRAFKWRMAEATFEERRRKNLELRFLVEPETRPREWYVGDSVIERWRWEPAVMESYQEYQTRLREYWTARWTAAGLDVDEKKAELGWEENAK